MFDPIELRPFVLYELDIVGLGLEVRLDGELSLINTDEALRNGRGSYLIFEQLVRLIFGLEKATGSDHQDKDGNLFEQKAYLDPQHRAYRSPGTFRTSASNTFASNGVNNYGNEIKRLLQNGDYDAAREICIMTGYRKNNAYIYTNTRNFDLTYPFRCIAIPTRRVMRLLSKVDPRDIAIEDILDCAVDQVFL